MEFDVDCDDSRFIFFCLQRPFIPSKPSPDDKAGVEDPSTTRSFYEKEKLVPVDGKDRGRVFARGAGLSIGRAVGI